MTKIIQDSLLSYNKIHRQPICQVRLNKRHEFDDFLAVEMPVEIRLSHNTSDFETLMLTMCSPSEVNDLVYGYLLTESIIKEVLEVLSIDIFDEAFGLIVEVVVDDSIQYKDHLKHRSKVMHASCGVCGKNNLEKMFLQKYPTITTTKKICDEVIRSLPAKIHDEQMAFSQTGGVHACALFSFSGKLLLLREDIGRHNALDKLLGAALQKGLLPLSDHMVLLSGRVSFELVHKCLMAGVAVVAAIGAPSSMSVELAQANGLTLIGFIKKNRYNLYT